MSDNVDLVKYRMLSNEQRGTVNAAARQVIVGLRSAGIAIPPINRYRDVRFHIILETFAAWALDGAGDASDDDAAGAPSLERGRSRCKSDDEDEIERERSNHSGRGRGR